MKMSLFHELPFFRFLGQLCNFKREFSLGKLWVEEGNPSGAIMKVRELERDLGKK